MNNDQLKRRGGRRSRGGRLGEMFSECVFNTFAELTTPAASRRNGNFLLMSRPPLLFKEGKKSQPPFFGAPSLLASQEIVRVDLRRAARREWRTLKAQDESEPNTDLKDLRHHFRYA